MKKSILAITIFFVVQIVLLACAMGVAAAQSGTSFISVDLNTPGNADILGFSTLFSGLIITLLITLMNRRFVPDVRPALTGRTLFITVFSTVLMAFALSILLNPLNDMDGGTSAQFKAMGNSAVCIVALCFMGPVAEEMTFRYGILANLRKSGMSPMLAVIVSAAVFAIAHLNLFQGMSAFAFGLLFGYVYIITGSLIFCIIGHILNNSLAMVSLHYPGLEQSLNTSSYAITMPIGVALLVAAALCVLKLKNPYLRTDENRED